MSAVETTHMVLPPDTNAYGTAFGGKIMEWMDETAAIAALRHHGAPVVTVAVDDMVFAQPIRLGDVVTLKACVNYAGRTSMEVGVRVEREILGTQRVEHCLTGYFTFVAVDNKGRPIEVSHGLTPITETEKRRYAKAHDRRAHRLAVRRKMTSKHP